MAGIKAQQILVVGASAGWHIAINVSAVLKNDELKFVIMGGCWPNDYKEYEQLQIRGRFLSIIERSDPHGSCLRIFTQRQAVKSYEEVTLNTGLSHGFIYKGHLEWIDPIMEWCRKAD